MVDESDVTIVPMRVVQATDGVFLCSGEVLVSIRYVDRSLERVNFAISVGGGDEYGVPLDLGEVFVAQIPVNVTFPVG